MFVVGDTHPQTVTIDGFTSADKLDFTMAASDFTVTAAGDGHAMVQYGPDTVNVMGMTPDQLTQANFILPPVS